MYLAFKNQKQGVKKVNNAIREVLLMQLQKTAKITSTNKQETKGTKQETWYRLTYLELRK